MTQALCASDTSPVQGAGLRGARAHEALGMREARQVFFWYWKHLPRIRRAAWQVWD